MKATQMRGPAQHYIQRKTSNSSSSFSKKSDEKKTTDKGRGRRRGLETVIKGFLSDVGCLGSNTLSKAVSNDINPSTSFVILDGVSFISLGNFTKNTNNKFIEEACDRWINRMEIYMHLGSVAFEKPDPDEVEIYRLELENDNNKDNTNPAIKATPKIIKKNLPRVTFKKDSDTTPHHISANRVLPPHFVLALTYLTELRFSQALEKFDCIYKADRKQYSSSHLVVGIDIHNLGLINLLVGNNEVALNCFQRAIVIKKGTLPENDPLIADSLVQLGNLLFSRGEFYAAQSLFNEAHSMLEDNQSLGSRSLLNAINNNIGCVHVYLGKLKEALVFFERASSDSRLYSGSDPNAELSLLNDSIAQANIGCVKLGMRKFDEAMVVLEEALLVQESVLNDDNITIQNTKSNIAYCKSHGCI